MDEQRNEKQQEQTPESGYTPRPAWQVWAARIGLVVFILFVIYQIMNIAGGGF